jgi:LPS export ABC transporter protein LptC
MIVILWIFQDNVLSVSVLKNSSSEIELLETKDTDSAYLEKIEKFSIIEYSNNEKILYKINADIYHSYKNSPVELLNVQVKSFNESQLEAAIMSSNRAQIQESGEIIFNGNVNIETINNVYHEIDSETFIFTPNKGEIKSNEEVFYKGERAEIKANGMLMNIDNDKLVLKDTVNITHDSGAIVDTSELLINHSNGEKIYTSENKTLYRSNENEITANAGLIMDMNKNLTNLRGKVNILQKSGATIKTSNLQVDSSNDKEIYKTDYPTEYISGESNIKSNRMYYDVISKKIDLFGAVNAIYE